MSFNLASIVRVELPARVDLVGRSVEIDEPTGSNPP